MEAKSLFGCCINLYNDSESVSNYYQSSYPNALSYDLWISCGVESPGICQNTLNLNLSRSTRGENYYDVTTESGGYSSSESIITDNVPTPEPMESIDSYSSSKNITDVTTESRYSLVAVKPLSTTVSQQQ